MEDSQPAAGSTPWGALASRKGSDKGNAKACALIKGQSSTWRLSSSMRMSAAVTSFKGANCKRSKSRAMARCTGLSRGWAARAMRSSADCKAATKGAKLPVSWACWWAKRRLELRSCTKVSSRERVKLAISSSSCERCKLTSDKRASAKVNRACKVWVTCWLCSAMLRA